MVVTIFQFIATRMRIQELQQIGTRSTVKRHQVVLVVSDIDIGVSCLCDIYNIICVSYFVKMIARCFQLLCLCFNVFCGNGVAMFVPRICTVKCSHCTTFRLTYGSIQATEICQFNCTAIQCVNTISDRELVYVIVVIGCHQWTLIVCGKHQVRTLTGYFQKYLL